MRLQFRKSFHATTSSHDHDDRWLLHAGVSKEVEIWAPFNTWVIRNSAGTLMAMSWGRHPIIMIFSSNVYMISNAVLKLEKCSCHASKLYSSLNYFFVYHVDHGSGQTHVCMHGNGVHCGPIDSFHRCRHPLAACCEPAGKLWQLCKELYVFEHKMQYLLIHAPYTRIVVFWHTSNIPPMISKGQICFNIATFCTTSIFVKYCYTTDSWML